MSRLRKAKIRVLVVDDSAFMRQIIGDILSAEPELEVVGRVRNGLEAIRVLEELKPDVITLDIEMPGKNGLEVLRDIMQLRPTPVVMVSSLTQEGANVTMQALDAGAVDFVTKPSGTISLDMEKVGFELRQKVAAASKVSPKRLGARGAFFPEGASGLQAPLVRSKKGGLLRRVEMVVIAASTGGPMALQSILPMLPRAFPVPIMVVQHMPAGFTASFAQRLDERSEIGVEEATEGMPVRKGMAIIAPGGFHLVAERKNANLVCKLLDSSPVRSVKPSADVLFSSVADVVGGNVLALILTGMGKDGTEGTRELKKKGAYVIAESRETSVVYGMPGSVVDAGLADLVLPLYAIGSEMENLLGL